MITIDGIRGDVKMSIMKPDDNRVLRFRWYKVEESTGFTSSVNKDQLPVTELAAEMMLRLVVKSLLSVLGITPDEVNYFNHLGEQLDDIEFMPPTFDGKEVDIQKFVSLQDSLKSLYLSYEENHALTSDLLSVCEQSEVLDDFLSLVQLQLSKVVFTFSSPKE